MFLFKVEVLSLCFVQMLSRYWTLWQDRLEEAEDLSFLPLKEKAETNYRWVGASAPQLGVLPSCSCASAACVKID